jgi:hypothetical protein
VVGTATLSGGLASLGTSTLLSCFAPDPFSSVVGIAGNYRTQSRRMQSRSRQLSRFWQPVSWGWAPLYAENQRNCPRYCGIRLGDEIEQRALGVAPGEVGDEHFTDPEPGSEKADMP